MYFGLAGMVHSFNPSTLEVGVGGSLEFEASLVYIPGQPGSQRHTLTLSFVTFMTQHFQASADCPPQ